MEADARLVRWGGYAALGAVAAMVVGIASLVVPTGGRTYRFRDAAGSLAFVDEHQLLMALFLWLGVLGFALLVIAVLGVQAMLRGATVPTVLGVVPAVLGVGLWILWALVWLGIVYELAPAHAAVAAADQPAIEAVVSGLITTANLFYAIGAAAFFLGIAVLSAAVLQTGAAPRWLGHLGLVAAVLAGVGGAAGQWLVAGFAVELVGWAAFVVWLVATALRMVRGPAMPAGR